MNNNLDLDSIHKFNKRYASAVASKNKDIRLSIEEAGLLNSAILSLLSINIEDLINNLNNDNDKKETNTEVLDIKMDAGSFKK